jgi:hypothetical protein
MAYSAQGRVSYLNPAARATLKLPGTARQYFANKQQT